MIVTTSMVKQMRELRQKGVAYGAIGGLVGVTPRTAQRYTCDIYVPGHNFERGPLYTEEEIAAAEQMWRDGVLKREIAERLGRTESSIRSMIGRHRERFPPRPRKKIAAEEVEEMRALRAQGVSIDDVAARMGVSASAVKKHTRGVKVVGR